MNITQWTKRILWGLFSITLIFALPTVIKHYFYTRTAEEYKPLRTLQKSFISQMRKGANLKCSGIGTGGTRGLNELFFCFRSTERIEQNQIHKARKIALNCSETLLNMVNSNKALRPYLSNYPFTYKNIEVEVLFITNKNDSIDSRSIQWVTVNKKGVRYDIHSDDTYGFIEIHKEPYSKAILLDKEKDSP